MRNIIAIIFLFSGTFTWAQNMSVTDKITSLPGTYKHKRPCKNCTGVENTLTLYCKVPANGGNYSYKEEYINSINGDHSSEVMGKWKIVDTAAGLDESSIIIGLTANNKPGKIMVPTKSICLRGFNVNLPKEAAVLSPYNFATQPCATSWTVIAKITGKIHTTIR